MIKKENESLTGYSLVVSYLEIGARNFARFQLQLPITGKTDWSGETLSYAVAHSWSLHCQYIIPSLLSHGFIINYIYLPIYNYHQEDCVNKI